MPEWEHNENPAGAEDGHPSKSERKRQMHALQELGASLLQLNDKQLAKIPIEDDQLLEALRDCRRIRSNSARKRQLQFIGKLMRSLDAAPIEAALNQLHQNRQRDTDAFHELEQLRDEILGRGVAGVELALEHYSGADRQQLRQLVLQHQRELKNNKTPAASRKLFRYLRELQQSETER